MLFFAYKILFFNEIINLPLKDLFFSFLWHQSDIATQVARTGAESRTRTGTGYNPEGF